MRPPILPVEVSGVELRQHGVGRGPGPDDPLYAQALARMQGLLEEAERERLAGLAMQSDPGNPGQLKSPGRRALARLLRRARAVIVVAIQHLRGPV
ncbi:MAG: hypothetical protein AB1609_09910 [Bacillota bacterium]